MAWTSVGSILTASDKASSASITFSVGANNPGDVLVLTVAKDNVSTVDGNTNEVTSVTDSGGNTWTKAREFTNGQGGAAAGATVAVFFTVLQVPISSVTINFASAVTAKAVSAWRFTVEAPASISVAAGADLAADGVGPGSMTLSDLVYGKYLWFRGIATESANTETWTFTTGYTAIGRAGTSGGGAATNMTVAGEFIIATDTSQTSNPTTSGNFDRASVFVALRENPLPKAAIFMSSDPPASLSVPPGLVVV
jgi:hypothetical protein